MNTTIIQKDFILSDEFIELSIDAKFLYFFLLFAPTKGYLNVFKLQKNAAVLCTGLSMQSVENGLRALSERDYIEIFNGYVSLKKGDSRVLKGFYNEVNKNRELEKIPVDVREHFDLDTGSIIVKEPKKKPAKKPGPAPDTIATILEKQPAPLAKALQDLVDDRIERKKAPTTRAVKGWIAKLEGMYPNQMDKRIKSIQQTIDRGWYGLFEVKEDRNSAGGGEFM